MRTHWTQSQFKQRWPLIVLLTLVVLATVLGSLGGAATVRATTLMVINVTIVCGLSIFVGNTGLLSFGHTSFTAIGAYAAGLLTIPIYQRSLALPDLPVFLQGAILPEIPANLVGGAMAALVAFLVAIPLMRLSGLAASIATLSLLVIVRVVLSNLDEVTGGRTALSVPMTSTPFSCLGWACLVIIAAYFFQESSIGLRLRASRESHIVAQTIGINIWRERVIAFVLSGFVAGFGGALYGHYLGSFTPDAFYLSATFMPIAMLVIGGISSLSGAVVGTVVISALMEFFRLFESGIVFGGITLKVPWGLSEIVVSLLMLLILWLKPEGLTGGREITWPFGYHIPRPPPASVSSDTAPRKT